MKEREIVVERNKQTKERKKKKKKTDYWKNRYISKKERKKKERTDYWMKGNKWNKKRGAYYKKWKTNKQTNKQSK